MVTVAAMNKRPLAVTIVGCVYIAAGAIGVAHHAGEFRAGHALSFDVFGIGLIRLAALVSGVFLLRGHNWARWLALVWIGLHVILSAFHAWSELAIHTLLFAAIAWALLCPDAVRYFRTRGAGQPGSGDAAGL